MEMMDVEACKRSRYRSLRFHGDSLNTLYPPMNGYYAPNHQSEFFLFRVGIRPCVHLTMSIMKTGRTGKEM